MLEALSGLYRGGDGDAIIQIMAAQAPTWLVEFPALLTPDRGGILRRDVLGATRERMLRAIGDALEAIASRSPLLIVFEDLQWVGYSTVDLISVLARRRTTAKLMIVGTYREDHVALSERNGTFARVRIGCDSVHHRTEDQPGIPAGLRAVYAPRARDLGASS